MALIETPLFLFDTAKGISVGQIEPKFLYYTKLKIYLPYFVLENYCKIVFKEKKGE